MGRHGLPPCRCVHRSGLLRQRSHRLLRRLRARERGASGDHDGDAAVRVDLRERAAGRGQGVGARLHGRGGARLRGPPRSSAPRQRRTRGGRATRIERSWVFLVGGREIEVKSRREGSFYGAMMNQGRATSSDPLDESSAAPLPLDARTRLRRAARPSHAGRVDGPAVSHRSRYSRRPREGAHRRRRLRVASPRGRSEVRLRVRSDGREGRTWDNAGAVEDVATGSAAGPAAAYLLEHSLVSGSSFSLAQGRFAGRPSTMSVEIAENSDIWVGGPVAPVASGVLDE